VSDTYAAEGRRPGRPPKDESEKLVSLSLRIAPDLRNELDAAAKDENRSVTQLSKFALAAFLEARKRPPPAAEEEHERPARLGRSPLKNQRHLLDILGRAFGRDVAALMLAIGCLVNEDKNVARAWLVDPQVFGEVTNSIIALLQLIGPDEHPALFAAIRQALWDLPTTEPEPNAASLAAAMLAGDLAFEWGVTDERWAPVIRSWFGEAVLARIRRRLPEPDQTGS
jgi:hypothetical protein